jgi:nucleotide-binding universal stress UspA family protein
MYKRILAAVDGSSTSDLALQEAVRLAGESRSELRLVHVVNMVNLNVDLEYAGATEWLDAIRRAGETVADEAAAYAKQAGVNVEVRLVEIDTLGQRIPEKIVDEARIWPADIIVIGTHGRQGLHHLLMGSVAEGVIRIATVPVLLIRGK